MLLEASTCPTDGNHSLREWTGRCGVSRGDVSRGGKDRGVEENVTAGQAAMGSFERPSASNRFNRLNMAAMNWAPLIIHG
jgi:hypothetical protein